MHSKLAVEAALNICFASDYLQHPVNSGAFRSLAEGIAPMHFSMCLQHMEQLKKKIKLIASVTKYFGGGEALGRWCGTWISVTWQRPGPEGSSCFYEPGNCRLSLGCASCPEVFKFHIITWVSVEVRGWREMWQLCGKVGTKRCRDGYRTPSWCLGKYLRACKGRKNFHSCPQLPKS